MLNKNSTISKNIVTFDEAPMGGSKSLSNSTMMDTSYYKRQSVAQSSIVDDSGRSIYSVPH